MTIPVVRKTLLIVTVNVVFSDVVQYFAALIPLFLDYSYNMYIHILSTECGGKPTLPQLLNFPGKSGGINIPERIGTNYKIFGILLLNDEDGAKIDCIAKEEGELTHINLKILSKWLQGECMQAPMWSTIIEVLKKSNLGPLAEEISYVFNEVARV